MRDALVPSVEHRAPARERGYFAVALCHPKNPINIGSALRACHAYNAAMMVVEWRKAVKYSADTTKAWAHLPLLRVADGKLLSVVPYGCIPVAVEVVEGAQSLPTFSHPERAFYIFGPEDGSIPASILDSCPVKVVIPSRYCLNLAASVATVLYDRRAKEELRSKFSIHPEVKSHHRRASAVPGRSRGCSPDELDIPSEILHPANPPAGGPYGTTPWPGAPNHMGD